jgi:hypothetical protein
MDLQDAILERLSQLHRSGAATSCRLLKDHHGSFLRQQRTALDEKIGTMDATAMDVFKESILENVRKIQEHVRPVDVAKDGCVDRGLPGESRAAASRRRVRQMTHRHRPAIVRAEPYVPNTAAAQMVSGGSQFFLTLTRADLKTERTPERKLGVEGWRLTICDVSVEAVAVVLEVVRALRECREISPFEFTQVTFSYSRRAPPTTQPAAKALFESLSYLMYQLRVQPSYELLEVLRPGKWRMWSTDAACCTEKSW